MKATAASGTAAILAGCLLHATTAQAASAEREPSVLRMGEAFETTGTSTTTTTTSVSRTGTGEVSGMSALAAEIGEGGDARLSEADRADPYVLEVDGTVFVFTTGDGEANLPVVSVSADGVQSAGDALSEVAVWSEPGSTWAPAVAATESGYVLYYTTRHVDSGLQCISVAVSDDPEGPYHDDSTTPLVCATALGGSIDPSPVQTSGGVRYLLWKSDGNCCDLPTGIYIQRLDATGTAVVADAARLVGADQTWEGDIVEAPSMLEIDGAWFLVYSGNDWDSDDYAVGYAVCDTVEGPCHKPSASPLLDSADGETGPGGAELVENAGEPVLVYHAWSTVVGYAAGGRRTLHTKPVEVEAAPARLRLSSADSQ